MENIKVGKNQILLPSGILVSKDGKYHYWRCTVSGLMTFAKPDYWVKVMEKYKTEENLAKTFVCRKARKLLELGRTPEQIKDLLNADLPKTGKRQRKPKLESNESAPKSRKYKEPKRKKLKSFSSGSINTVVQASSGEYVPEVKKIYPWSGNPNYFLDGPGGPINYEEATKDSCFYPNRYLDDRCYGCSLYNRCNLPTKYTEEDWKKPRTKDIVKIKRIVMDE